MTAPVPPSTTFSEADMVLLVDGQNHLYFRRPSRVADLVNSTPTTRAPIRSVVVIDRNSGLTSTWRES